MTTSGIKRGARRPGFTLLEVLLVTALIAISVAVGAPYFVRSMRGNRLRVAARTVAMAARYARGMAVMRQQVFRLSAAGGGNSLTIAPVAERRARGESDFPDAPAAGGGDASPAAAPIRRELDAVTIVAVRAAGADGDLEGGLDAFFYPNGTCDAFELRLRETGGREISVRVDELGSVRVVEEDAP